jgi:hypothetical protein
MLSGADVGEDDGVVTVWTEVACVFRMFETGEAVDSPVDEWRGRVVTTLFSKMSSCAPSPKLYKSRYNGGE